jgi:hypothetical protein
VRGRPTKTAAPLDIQACPDSRFRHHKRSD